MKKPILTCHRRPVFEKKRTNAKSVKICDFSQSLFFAI